jgi:hypothetical protein
MPCHGGLYKCRDAAGAISYSDSPCTGQQLPMRDNGTVSRVKIPQRAFVPAAKLDESGGGAVSSVGNSSNKPAPPSADSSTGGNHY